MSAKTGLQLEQLVVPIVPDIARYRRELKKVEASTIASGRRIEKSVTRYFVNPFNQVGPAARRAFNDMANSAARAASNLQRTGQIGRQSMRLLSRASRRSAADIKDLQLQVRKLTTDMRRLEAMAKRAGKAVNNTKNANNRRGSGGMLEAGFGLGMAGAGLTAGVTAPIVGAAGFGIKQMIDFESSFAGVLKTVNGSEQQLQDISSGFRQMALDIPISVNELNRIGESAGQLGIRTESILGFTEVMAMMGVTTNMSSEAAATALAQFANITQMSQNQFENLGSTVVHLGNRFATTESEIVEMGLRIAGAGKVAGMSEADILALATASASLGVNVEMGGTAMSKLIERMAQVTAAAKGARTAFSDVAGMSGEMYAAMVKNDPAQAFNEFVMGLNRIYKAGGDVRGVLIEMGITERRISDQILRLATSGDMLTRTLADSKVGWQENNALVEEARKRFATTESQIQLMWNAVVELGIQLGEFLAPAVLKVVEFIRAAIPHLEMMLKYFTDMPTWLQYTTVALLALAAAAGPVLMLFSGLIITIGGLSFALSTLGVTLGTVSMMAAGVGLALGLVVAAAIPLYMHLVKPFHDLNMEIERTLELTGQLNKVERKRQQEFLDKTQDMAPQQQVRAFAQKEAQEAKELVGKERALADAQRKVEELRQQSYNAKLSVKMGLPMGGDTRAVDKTVIEAAEKERDLAQKQVDMQKDWMRQLNQGKRNATRMGAIESSIPGVMTGEDLAANEAKDPVEAAKKRLLDMQSKMKAEDEARRQLGMEPRVKPKLEGVEAALAQIDKEQQRKDAMNQARAMKGLPPLDKPKLTGVALEIQKAQAKEQRTQDRETAYRQLGLPVPGSQTKPKRIGAPARARYLQQQMRMGGVGVGAMSGMGGGAGMGQAALSPRQQAIATIMAKRAERKRYNLEAQKDKQRQESQHAWGAVKHNQGWNMADFASKKTPQRPAGKKAISPLKEAVTEGTIAAKENKMTPTYEDNEIGYLQRIADNTAGLRGRTIVVAPANLEKA